MLAERPQVSARDSETSSTGSADPGSAGTGLRSTGRNSTDPAPAEAGAAPVTGSFGARSARKKRGLLRRTGIALPAAALALLLVVVVWGAAAVMNPQGTGASSLFQSIDGLGRSGSVALLEQERQALVEITAASKAVTLAAKPVKANPEQILESENSSTTSSSETTGGTGITTIAPPSNPTAAEETGKSMLASFGFSSSQWSCLYSLWQRESGWNVYAENAASGAYGIPQSLPGSKMAAAGADWATDAATQIRWGLGYIKSVYGTPCAAWGNEEADGFY
jgi:hypothetical protein